MNDTEADANPNATNTHLGFRIAVGVVGVALLIMFAMLGSVAMKQSATSQALEAEESLREEAGSAPARE
jgi:hypothetical protein